MRIRPLNKLILALDVESATAARKLFVNLRDVVGGFKIGSQLFTAEGPNLIREFVAAGAYIFLDLKFHDIPNTVAAAGVEAARLGISMFNVHASGGSEMMRRTNEAVKEAAMREGLIEPNVIGVTVLTSSNAQTIIEAGVTDVLEDHVIRLARLTWESGLDGVVASPLEIESIRTAVGSRDFLIVTPGVRPASSPVHDQRRIMTPAEAIGRGADLIVVGRAILDAADPVLAARNIVEEIKVCDFGLSART